MNIGFIGASKILETVIPIFSKFPDKFTLYGISSRDKEKALEFQKKYSICKVFDSYEDLAKDDNIELVYVSTVISKHYEDVKLCLKNNKNVIVEKSFTKSYKEAKELIDLAKKKNLYLEEAIWTRFMPSRNIINKIINSKLIGDVYYIEANLGYNIFNVERIKNPLLGGGALLDVGVYPLNFIDMFARSVNQTNEIVSFNVMSKLTNLGVDETICGNIIYQNGIIGNFFATINNLTTRIGYIYGKDGIIKVTNINNPELIEVYKRNNIKKNKFDLVSKIKVKEEVNGYEYEFLEAFDLINKKRIESNSMPLNDSLRMMNLMNNMLKKIKSKVVETNKKN
mgnify:FL=1